MAMLFPYLNIYTTQSVLASINIDTVHAGNVRLVNFENCFSNFFDLISVDYLA